MDRILLSIPAAAQVLGLGRSHVYVMIGLGELETVKIGRRCLVVAQSVEDFVASLRQAA